MRNNYYGIQKKIANDIGISERSIRDCVWFRNTLEAPDWDKAVMKLPDTVYNFNQAKRELKAPEDKCEHKNIEKITRYRCQDCGKI